MGSGDIIVRTGEDTGVPQLRAAVLRSLRPKQWVKNGLVFLPFVFAVNQVWSPTDLTPIPGFLVQLMVLLAAFCALSSAVYLLNDLLDRDADRQHPIKRHRPIASGKVGVPAAVALMVVLGGTGLITMTVLRPVLGGLGLTYLLINVFYSLGLKKVVLVDVLFVASGYVIRAASGAVVIGAIASPWLYAVTAAGALFMVLGRRYAEVRLADQDVSRQRPVLRAYGGPFIGQLLGIAATAALISYTLYTVEAESLPANHTMLLTVPLVTFGLFRYLYLLNTNAEAESPEQLITRDVPLVAAILCWVGVSAMVLLLNS